MGQSKLSRYLGMSLFSSAIICMIGFWWSRTSNHESFWLWAPALKWTLIALGVMGGYMAAVGLYHTILAALGLDGEPGIFSQGGRSGPFSGPPVDAHHAVPVEGAGVVQDPPEPGGSRRQPAAASASPGSGTAASPSPPADQVH